MGAIHQALLATGGAGGGASDPDFANVVLLAHFDGADGATTTTDSSSLAHTLTMNGTGPTAEIDTAQSKFGGSSGLFTGVTASTSVSSPDSDDWNLGSGDFTIEGFARWNDKDSDSGNQALISQFQSNGNQRAWYIRLATGNTLQAFFSANGTADGLGGALSAAFTPTNGVWYYIVFERSGTTWRLVVDTTILDSTTATLTGFNSTEVLRLGALGTSGVANQFFNGWLDEWRVTKGVARYNGTYVVPTTAFPNS